MRGLLNRHGGDGDRGAVVPIIALSLVTLVVMTAFSIDIGRQILHRRDAQAVADVVALDLSRLVNGRQAQDIKADPRWTSYQTDGATRNNWTGTLVADTGTFVPATGTFTPVNGTGVPNAARVTASDTVNFFFANVVGITNGSVTRTAVATNSAKACMSIGSFAVALSANPSSLLPSFLSNSLNISLFSYSGLANAQVTLRDLAAQLGFATPSQLFTSNVKEKDFIIAEANALGASGDTADATALNNIAAGVSGSSTFNFGSLMSVQQGSEQDALDTAFNALDLLAASAFLANGTNAISIPSATLTVPGVSNLTASVKVIEQPRSGCGGLGGPPVSTGQVTLTLDFNVAVLLSVYSVHVVLDAASATATLVPPLTCGPPAQANVNVASSLVTTTIKQTLLGVAVTATTNQNAGGNTVSFTIPPDQYNVMKRSGNGSIGLSNSSVVGLNAGVVTVLNSLFASVDAGLMKPLSQVVGIDVGGADVEIGPTPIECSAIKLAL